MRYIQTSITNEMFIRLKMYCLKSGKSVMGVITSALIYYLDLKENEASELKKLEGATNSDPLHKVRDKSLVRVGKSEV
jgi:hypothetical protein